MRAVGAARGRDAAAEAADGDDAVFVLREDLGRVTVCGYDDFAGADGAARGLVVMRLMLLACWLAGSAPFGGDGLGAGGPFWLAISVLL